MSRPGGFSSDINNICTIPDHFFCMLQSRIQVPVSSAIREGIRCYIQDSHHIRALSDFKVAVSDCHNLIFHNLSILISILVHNYYHFNIFTMKPPPLYLYFFNLKHPNNSLLIEKGCRQATTFFRVDRFDIT